MRARRLLAAVAALACTLALAAMPVAAEGDAAEGWHTVHFADLITAADREVLEARGAEGVQYLPHQAYLAWLDTGAVEALRGRSGITRVTSLAPADKIDAALFRSPAPHRMVVTAHAQELEAVLARLDRVAEVALHRPSDPTGILQDIYLTAPPASASVIAAIPAVRYVGPAPTGPVSLDEISNQILAGNQEELQRPPIGYEDWLAGVALDGDGVRVSIVDTGIDPHPDFDDRLVAKVEYSRTGAEPLDVGHGTHVAGIVGGNPTDLPVHGRVTDSDGYLYGLGVAPAVELVDQNALSITGSLLLCGFLWPPPDYGWERLSEDALDHGAAISNNSWQSCEGTGAGYIQSARTFDMLARNADWRTDEHEPFTFVFAAGNNGDGDESRITAPSEAKNLISVAASTNFRAGGIGRQTAGFSSRGPAVDGRVAPTVSAPGANIMSTRAFTATAICGVPPRDSLLLYADCSGTSMAAPHVAGAVALLTQWWRADNDGADPSPAMSRALLVNTAEPLGFNGPIPNKHEGWGLVNIGSLFDGEAQRTYLDESVVLTDTGDSHTVTVRPSRVGEPLRITLAWTDAPGAAGADLALVNDLDLEVTAPDGSVYRGNVLDDSWSVAGGQADRLNNVENIFLTEAADGTYTITVAAHQLPGDGVPANPGLTDQDFALVISNGVLVSE